MSPSGSDVVTGAPTSVPAGLFSGTSRTALLEANTGGLLPALSDSGTAKFAVQVRPVLAQESVLPVTVASERRNGNWIETFSTRSAMVAFVGVALTSISSVPSMARVIAVTV